MSEVPLSTLRLAVRRIPLPANGTGVAIRVPADLRCVEEAVELMAFHCFAGAAPSRRTRFRFRVLLAEAISNGIIFGAGEDPLASVRVVAELTEGRIRLEVTDEGPGFVPDTIPDPRAPDTIERGCGRGLFLIRSLADSVEFNEQGNTIWMTLPRD
ncbi:MAG: ATP-binding protein [Gemmatimonadales bacterium]